MRKSTIAFLGAVIAILTCLVGTTQGRTVDGVQLKTSSSRGPHPVVHAPRMAGIAAGEYELIYDNGAEVYSPDDDVVDAEWAVRFTSPQPCSLVYIRLVTFQPAGPLSISIYNDDGGGGPGTVKAGPFYVYATGDLTDQRIDFPTPVDVGASDFHVAIKIMQAATPHPTFDNDGGTLRTTYHSAGQPWGAVSNLDMVMRAYVRLYGADITPPTIWHIPVQMAFSEDGPVPISAQINDQNGISSANVRYSANGISYSSAAMTGGAGVFTGAIPSFSAGTNVRYYIDARDASPQQNIGLLPAGGSSAPLTFMAQPGHQLMYDDGAPEQFWIESDIYDGNAFAVNFTPSHYPAIVSHLRVLLNDTVSVALTIQKNTGGAPGDVIAGPFVASANPYTGWADVIIPEGQQPLITIGDFYVVLWWFPASPALPGVATDTTQKYNRSAWYDNAFGWNRFPLGNFMIRAAVQNPTGISESGGNGTPSDWTLEPNYPNPFNPSTSISFSIPSVSAVRLDIHNVLGQSVRELYSGQLNPGRYTIDWDGRDQRGNTVNSGVYFFTLQTNSHTQSRKMLLLK